MGTFGLDAYIVGGAGQHSREDDHFAEQPDSVITVTGLSGYANGTLLPVVLASLFGRAEDLGAFPGFGLDAVIDPAPVTPQAGSYALDAWLANGASFGLDSIIGRTRSRNVGLDAVIAATQSWNIVMSPLGGATASYTSSHNWSSLQPDGAADGLTAPVGSVMFGEGWAASPYTAGATWWQVTWTGAPQSLDRVILWDYAHMSGYFGDGRLLFSDGSEVPFTGLPHQQIDSHNRVLGNLIIDFPKKMGITWMRVISDSGGVAPAGLHEVRAYDMEQYD